MMKKLLENRVIVFLVISAAGLGLSLFGISAPLGVDFSWMAIVLCGVPICLEAVEGLVKRHDIKADVLVALALVASVCTGEYFAAGEVAFIMKLGELLEDFTVRRAKAGIERLVRLTPTTAHRLLDGVEETVDATTVKVGDLLRVLPGESVPVDGIVVNGLTSIDESVLTGEPIPVDKMSGDKVSSGTVNRFGAFEMRAEKVGEDSSMQRLVRLAATADAGKARIVGMEDKWATWIVISALAAAALTWLASGECIRAATILVVFCPCSLVLATPAAIMCASYQTISANDLLTPSTGIAMNLSGNVTIYDPSLENDSTTEFKSDMSGITLYYALATPVTHDLGTVTLPALPAPDLTAWAQTDPTTTVHVGYERDANIAIQQVYANLAPIEQPKATGNHAVGELLVVGERLVKVTSAIATGETIAIGTNVAATTVAAQLALKADA